jgi:hypothetical protein
MLLLKGVEFLLRPTTRGVQHGPGIHEAVSLNSKRHQMALIQVHSTPETYR